MLLYGGLLDRSPDCRLPSSCFTYSQKKISRDISAALMGQVNRKRKTEMDDDQARSSMLFPTRSGELAKEAFRKMTDMIDMLQNNQKFTTYSALLKTSCPCIDRSHAMLAMAVLGHG